VLAAATGVEFFGRLIPFAASRLLPEFFDRANAQVADIAIALRPKA
jgi:hypothetical protein